MKIVATKRKLSTPQTTTKGRVRTNVAGQPIYTEYLKIQANEELKLRMKMRQEIDIVLQAMQQCNLTSFEAAVGFNIATKRQIDNEPTPYSWEQRLVMVDKRLNEKHKNLTTGIIDMYNNVVGSMYRGLGYPNSKLEDARIELVEMGHTSERPKIDSSLFEQMFAASTAKKEQ